MTCEKFAEPPLVIQIARTGLGARLLGPLFFNIFISDLFYHITEVKLHAYADDEQLYDSYTDPKLLDRRLMHQPNIANEWYRSNGMLVNATKH